MAASSSSSVLPSLPPPEYPVLYGKRRELAKVTYQTEFILDKNEDYVIAEHQALLSASKCSFVSGLFPLSSEESSKQSKFSSIGSRFKQQLQQLLETLSSTEPRYIRCVKPNNLLKPAIFENSNVLQLRCGVQDVILKPDPSKNDTMWLKKTLSCSYPNLPFNEALQKENEKLQLELQCSQANLDVGECEVIQHLLDVTEAVAVNSVSEKSSPMRISKKVEQNYSDVNSEKEHSYDESYTKQSETHSTSRNTSSVSSGRDLLSTRGSNWDDEWHSDLLGCSFEPILCMLYDYITALVIQLHDARTTTYFVYILNEHVLIGLSDINLKSVSFSMFYLSRAER
ncbi:hypothetical protein ACSBR2_028179 [Camellia fascicularis]